MRIRPATQLIRHFGGRLRGGQIEPAPSFSRLLLQLERERARQGRVVHVKLESVGASGAALLTNTVIRRVGL